MRQSIRIVICQFETYSFRLNKIKMNKMLHFQDEWKAMHFWLCIKYQTRWIFLSWKKKWREVKQTNAVWLFSIHFLNQFRVTTHSQRSQRNKHNLRTNIGSQHCKRWQFKMCIFKIVNIGISLPTSCHSGITVWVEYSRASMTFQYCTSRSYYQNRKWRTAVICVYRRRKMMWNWDHWSNWMTCSCITSAS